MLTLTMVIRFDFWTYLRVREAQCKPALPKRMKTLCVLVSFVVSDFLTLRH